MVVVDQALCTGCGLCLELCPEIFIWGPDGKAVVIKNYCEIHSTEEIAAQCPTEAIDV